MVKLLIVVFFVIPVAAMVGYIISESVRMIDRGSIKLDESYDNSQDNIVESE